ncbi:1,3-beta-glucan synthase [Zostera marina]|uniref:1,3-beta-glucan synthase n=1 Tax=Zostera marina TaxID=29655 RepID=A0A0K9PAE5_ZOSMR|nr:1,3-beta-glucan synthase [Zostera marina]
MYRKKYKAVELRKEEIQLRESHEISSNLGELERKTLRRKKVFATLKVLARVLAKLTEEISPDGGEKLISDEVENMMKLDAEMTEDVVAYNIVPLDSSSDANKIAFLPEVKAAMSSLKYIRGLPELPSDFSVPTTRNVDILDFLHFVFGFQESNVSNQREHIVLLLANEQSRFFTPVGDDPKLDEDASRNVFEKALDNYFRWCKYLSIHPVCNRMDPVGMRLLFVSLYYLIWGEAANVRFLPECLCYIFHNMAKELTQIMRSDNAENANSCKSESGVSFLDHVISPLYATNENEAKNNNNGRAPHSAWRNYDDFNEYFWSRKCFADLQWPWKLDSSFFFHSKQKKKGFI